MRTKRAFWRSSARFGGAAVAHARAQPADELVDAALQAAAVRHAALDAFGHELLGLLDVALEVAVAAARRPSRRASPCRGRPCRSGPGRARPRRAPRRCRRRASRSSRRSTPAASALTTSPENLMPPSAMTGTPCARGDAGGVEDRGELRHADARDDARRADRARADADLDRRRARLDQRLGALGGRDVAADDRQLREGAAAARATVSSTAAEWPCAVSTTTTSTPASTSACARSRRSGPTPTAAPQRSRPQLVLARRSGSARSSRCP